MITLILLGIFLFLVAWFAPLVLGIRLARKKRITRKWMLFGIHPFLAWVGYLIIALTKPKRECPHCFNKIDARASICSYCLKESPKELNLIQKDNLHIGMAILAAPITAGAFYLLLFNTISYGIKNSWAYSEAWDRIENEPKAKDYLGGSLKEDWLFNGFTSSDSARYDIPINGAEGKGEVIIRAHKQKGNWQMDTLLLLDFNTGDTIDLNK